MISPEYLQNFQTQFNQLLNTNQGEKIKKLFNIDDKNPTRKRQQQPKTKPHRWRNR